MEAVYAKSIDKKSIATAAAASSSILNTIGVCDDNSAPKPNFYTTKQ